MKALALLPILLLAACSTTPSAVAIRPVNVAPVEETTSRAIASGESSALHLDKALAAESRIEAILRRRKQLKGFAK